MTSNEQSMRNALENLFEEFEAKRLERMEIGAKEYGETAFLNVNVFQFLYEELFDLANYAAMIYVRMRLMEAQIGSSINYTDPFDGEVSGESKLPFGVSTFTKGTGVPKTS